MLYIYMLYIYYYIHYITLYYIILYYIILYYIIYVHMYMLYLSLRLRQCGTCWDPLNSGHPSGRGSEPTVVQFDTEGSLRLRGWRLTVGPTKVMFVGL